ncbi:hypothetical protein R3P38DRAFT_2426030, partial [Favolaschia claudopus]
KPCTTSADFWRALCALVQATELHHDLFIIKSLIDPTIESFGPRCVFCKNEDHFASACKCLDDPEFWGPNKQIRDITEG